MTVTYQLVTSNGGREEALERLTANYDRAEIEEAGFDAVRDFLQAVGVSFAEMPDDEPQEG